MDSPAPKAYAEAIAYGIDFNLIECNLEMTIEERIDDHERALNMANELKKAFVQIHGISQDAS